MEGERRGEGAPVVTVFGSSRVRPGDREYADAQRLGELLGDRGWTLVNGGHEGTMEAAARGAKEHGGRTIGITISLYNGGNRNAWLDQEVVAETLFARLEQLVTRGEAYVVLRGGIGTLLELALVWNLVQSPEYAHKPILVIGASWNRVLATLREALPMHRWEERSITLVPTVEEAVERLDAFFGRSRSKSRPVGPRHNNQQPD